MNGYRLDMAGAFSGSTFSAAHEFAALNFMEAEAKRYGAEVAVLHKDGKPFAFIENGNTYIRGVKQ